MWKGLKHSRIWQDRRRRESKIRGMDMERIEPHTFSATSKFHCDLLIHILSQVEDILLLRFLASTVSASSFMSSYKFPISILLLHKTADISICQSVPGKHTSPTTSPSMFTSSSSPATTALISSSIGHQCAFEY
jgi:hypothetical protein